MLLGSSALAYAVFHLFRAHLPHGWIRDSFPSFLLPIVMFSIIDLREAIQFRSARIKFWMLFGTLLISMVWFEVVIPGIHRGSTSDPRDAVAMSLGFLLYLGIDRLRRRAADPLPSEVPHLASWRWWWSIERRALPPTGR
ncbi:MAG: hypothetical protein QOE70_923 [Chthoniobacter sp.]|jgi:hypothetical protein|nr:hypothetical protein [Chthoniobacter sp.]